MFQFVTFILFFAKQNFFLTQKHFLLLKIQIELILFIKIFKDCYRGAFTRGTNLETVMIDVSRLKNFDGDVEAPLEPGLQIFLMAEPRQAEGSRRPQFR